MNSERRDEHLSLISTVGTLLRQAGEADGPARLAAQQQLLERYGSPVRRYLQGILRNSEAADDLFQEFALRFLHGRLDGFNPERGRFRDFIKGVLFHLVAEHHRRQRRQPCAMPANCPEPADNPPTLADQDREFLASWRNDLLARAWAALAAFEQTTGQISYTVLRFRADHADLPSPKMAEQLSVQLGKPLTATGVRQMLHRARERFAEFLLEEVAQSLVNPVPEQLEQELIELGLLEHCRSALERWTKAEKTK